MDNWVKFSIFGGSVKLKKDIIPHRFECQPSRSNVSNVAPRAAYEKLNRKRQITEILTESAESENINSSPNTIECVENISTPRVGERTALSSIGNIQETPNKQQIIENTKSTEMSEENCENVSSQTLAHDPEKIYSFGEGPALSNYTKHDFQRLRDVGVQVRQSLTRPHYRSKEVQCVAKTRETSCQWDVTVVDRACSPIASFISRKTSKTPSDPLSSTTSNDSKNETASESIYADPSSDYVPSTDSEEAQEVSVEMKEKALCVTNYFISIDPKYYAGISRNWVWIIDELHVQSGISINDIKLTLTKVRLNNPYVELGRHYGLSNSQAGRIYRRTAPVLSHLLKTLIYSPAEASVMKALPIAFRANYSKVYTMIDAFEIEIQKPSNPLFQALTWSEYKKCNTLKFLIACNPDGMINFISDGYGGRISDVLLFEICGIMDILPANCRILADRGFKQLEEILRQKGIILQRPPSVSASSIPTKEEVRLTKQVASLRIHIERVIKRMREYKMLESHACLDLSLIRSINSAVRIAAGLSNLQNPIIRTM